MFNNGDRVLLDAQYRFRGMEIGHIRAILTLGGQGIPTSYVAVVEWQDGLIGRYPTYQLLKPDLRHFIKEALDKQQIMCYT